MILNRPFPANTSFVVTVRYSALAGLIVFLILFLFRPFNIDGPRNHFNIFHAFAYGAVTSGMLMLNATILPLIFKNAYREESWTLGKEILSMCWHILSIAFVNVLVTHLLYGIPMNARSVTNFLLITSAVGIFPVAFILLIKQQLLYKHYHRTANAIEEDLASAPVIAQTVEAEPVVLRGDNAGEEIKLPADAFRYITAADNYLRVFYLKDEKLQTTVLRSTLKKAEQMLAANPGFLRCHRAYIVNLSCVQHLSGNAQGLKLHLTNVDELIPVSRAQNDSISAELRKFSPLIPAAFPSVP